MEIQGRELALSREFLLARGKCCHLGCKNCPYKEKKMKAYCISDTHGYHFNLKIPTDVDLIIHCGDATNSRNPIQNSVEMYNFLEWFNTLPIKHKIYVPGNHDAAMATGMVEIAKYDIHFLVNSSVTIEGKKFWGSPYTPRYGDWVYMLNRNRMQRVWELMEPADVVITHGPPKGYLDLTDDVENREIVHVGCKSLANKILEVKPKFHCFGHIHSDKNNNNYGIFHDPSGIIFVNAACLSHDHKFYNGHILEV